MSDRPSQVVIIMMYNPMQKNNLPKWVTFRGIRNLRNEKTEQISRFNKIRFSNQLLFENKRENSTFFIAIN
jgi:hypothetical protein